MLSSDGEVVQEGDCPTTDDDMMMTVKLFGQSPGFFLVCVLPHKVVVVVGGGLSVFLGGWVSNCPPHPPSPRRVGHCGGLQVSAKGAGQGILTVVRHFAYGSWVDGWVGGCFSKCLFSFDAPLLCHESPSCGLVLMGRVVGGALSAVRAQCGRTATIWASSRTGDPYFVILGASLLPLA